MELPPDVEAVLDRSQIEALAKSRYEGSNSYQGALATKYQLYHHYAFPPNTGRGSGDQWPAEAAAHPDDIHVTANIVFPFAQVDARLQAIAPRITIPMQNIKPEDRQRAEATEAIALTWLDLSGWDTWMDTLCLGKALYGKGVLKPFWNARDKRGDVYVIENIEDLRIGWGRSDFSVIDWALYESRMSVAEAYRTFPGIGIEQSKQTTGPKFKVVWNGAPEDPLGQHMEFARPWRQPSQYETEMVTVWDYWWIDGETVKNVTLIEGCCVEEPKAHPEMPAIPYIVIENDHEPGNPDGVSSVECLMDLQMELNRLLSHAYQHVQDNIDPAYYAFGEDAGNLEPGTVPKRREILYTGTSQINPVTSTTNTMPFADLIGQTWNAAHRISGLPEILFGDAPADISGRATAIQIQSAVNRIDPRRKRLYRGLTDLLRFWMYMAVKKDPSMPAGVDEETGEPKTTRLSDILRGFDRWKIVAPEITPRDAAELTTNEINKMGAGLSSARTSMDAIGIESPEAELDLIREERDDLGYKPDAVQQKVSAYLMMLQFQQMLQQMQMTEEQLQGQASAVGGPGMSPTAQAQKATNTAQNNTNGAVPGAMGEDQNQPPTGAPGGQPPQVQTLVRPDGVLTQTAFNQSLGA